MVDLSLTPCSQLDFILELNSCGFLLDDAALDMVCKRSIEKNFGTVFTPTH